MIPLVRNSRKCKQSIEQKADQWLIESGMWEERMFYKGAQETSGGAEHVHYHD